MPSSKNEICEEKPRPKCKVCGRPVRVRPGKSILGFTMYQKLCAICLKRPYRKHLKSTCEFCGFKAVHTCQLDIDHKEGNSKNNKEENLQTLCANCHRLKTQLHKDFINSKNKQS